MIGEPVIIPDRKTFRKMAKQGNLIPVFQEVLADMETPVSAYAKLEQGEYGYLLESVEGEERIGRYSFLGTRPRWILVGKGRKTWLKEGEKTTELDDPDPLSALERIMKGYEAVPHPGLPVFAGGAVGFMGYGMIRLIEEIPETKPDDLGMPDLYFMFTDSAVVFDHVKHRMVVVRHAEIRGDADEAYDRAVKEVRRTVAEFRARLPVLLEKKRSSKRKPRFRSNFKREEFEDAVRKCKSYIRAGDIFQVVLSQRLSSRLSAHPFDVYRALRVVNPSPYMYYLRFGDLQIVGSSPEILVRVEGDEVCVRPIAGTRPRGTSQEKDEALERELLGDEKEKAEHIMLVDLGRNDVGRVCEYGSVHPTELMVIERYSHVMHIVSDVKGKLARGKTGFDALRACFPAGTVTGAPKIRAMEIIEELEPHQRGPYAGAIGYLSLSGNLDTCITIRTIVVSKDKAYVQAGAGIVADSQPAREYEETMNKAKALTKAIQMAEEGLE